MHGGGRGCEECIRRNHHLSILDGKDPENDLEGTRSAAHRYGVGHVVAKGKCLLEFACVRSESEGAALQRLVDHAQDLQAILRRERDPSSRYTRSGHVVGAALAGPACPGSTGATHLTARRPAPLDAPGSEREI